MTIHEIQGRRGRIPPWDEEAETVIVGSMLASRRARDQAYAVGLASAHFYKPLFRNLYAAMLALHHTGYAIDRTALRAELKKHGTTIDDATVSNLQAAAALTESIQGPAEVVMRDAAARGVLALCDRAVEHAWDGDAARALEIIHAGEDALVPTFEQVDPPIGASQLAEEDHAVDWIVPGWLARHETILFVAEPGAGKTTLLNQTATCMASALHPWSRTKMHAPVRVLVFDFQDSRGARGRGVQKMLACAGNTYPGNRGEPDTLFYELRTQGIDLTTLTDQRWFEAKIVACQPDVVVSGPLYNMVKGAPNRSKQSEETAEIAGAFLSELAIRRNFALLIEAHAPHGDELRVRGSKYWEDWAGWGIGLAFSMPEGRREFALRKFRGDREAGRYWPTRWVQGHQTTDREMWPWEAVGGNEPGGGGHPEQQTF